MSYCLYHFLYFDIEFFIFQNIDFFLFLAMIFRKFSDFFFFFLQIKKKTKKFITLIKKNTFKQFFISDYNYFIILLIFCELKIE